MEFPVEWQPDSEPRENASSDAGAALAGMAGKDGARYRLRDQKLSD